MDLTNAVEPVTVLKTNTARLINKARQSRQPIVITQSGKPVAVLQDVESYERTRKALLLLKFLAKGKREIEEGKGIPHAEVERRVRRKLRTSKG